MAVTDPDFPAIQPIRVARSAALVAQAQARAVAGETPNIVAAGSDRILFTDVETGITLSVLFSNLGITAAQGAVSNGPVPTGVAATDTANIISFLASSSQGDHLVFPAGEYSINQTIYYPSGRHYTGAGAKGVTNERTCFKMANSANLDAVWASALWSSASATPVSATPVLFDYLCFDGNRDNQSSGAGHGLVGMNYQSSVYECKFANTRGDGLRWSSATSAGNTITNTMNELYLVENQCLNTGGAQIRIFEGDATNRITDGFAINNIGFGSDGRGLDIDKGAGWLVAGNHMYSVSTDSIRIGAAFGTKVINNYCEGWGSSATPGTYHGINLSTSGLISGLACVVANNTVWANSTPTTGTALRGIAVTAANSQSVNVSITGNSLTGRTFTTATTGIQVNANNAGATIRATVVGNNSESWDSPFAAGTTGTVNIVGAGNLGAIIPNETFSSTPAINVAKAAINGVWRMIITGNVSPTIPDGVDGQTIIVQFQQNGTGNFTATWPANVVGGPTLATAANAVTTVFLTYIASTDVWYAK